MDMTTFCFGAHGEDPNGSVDAGSAYLYSGRDGALIRRMDGLHDKDAFGNHVAAGGDLDHDGCSDALIGAIAGAQSGRVYVMSGRTGAVIQEFRGEGAFDLLYKSAGLGDVNRDGSTDLILGASNADPGGLAGLPAVPMCGPLLRSTPIRMVFRITWKT